MHSAVDLEVEVEQIAARGGGGGGEADLWSRELTGGRCRALRVTGLVAIAGQLRITAWFGNRWGSTGSLSVGMTLMAAAFLPLVASAATHQRNIATK